MEIKWVINILMLQINVGENVSFNYKNRIEIN